MDVKYILSSVAKEAEKIGASGKLLAGVRLTGSVNGERGEGYWLLHEENLVLLYRKLGQRDYEGCAGELSDWTFADYREEKYALMLNSTCAGTTYLFEFTPAERESAEIILNAITQDQTELQTIYSEELLVMAALFSYLSSDGHEDFAASLLGKSFLRIGRKYASKHSLPDLVERGNTLFSMEQKESVLANLIEQRMSDGLWSSQESSALRELTEVWGITQDYFENCAGIMLRRHKIWELFKN